MAKDITLLHRAGRGAILLMVIAVLPASLSWSRLKQADGNLLPYELTVNDSKLSQPDIVWVDSRSADAYNQGHITGAVLLNEDGWDKMLEGVFRLWQPGRIVVAYCDEGCSASSEIAAKLRDLGIDPVYVLKGGYPAWKRNHR